MKSRERLTISLNGKEVANPKDVGTAFEIMKKLPGSVLIYATYEEYRIHEVRRAFPEWFDG